MVVLDTGGGSSAASSIGGILKSMIPVMVGAGMAQVDMALVMSIINTAKTAASDVEDASKKT
jgi:hypothetical protein